MLSLNEIKIDSTAIEHTVGVWDAIESCAETANLSFSGLIGAKLDALCIGWRVKEVCRLTRCKGLLVDMRKLSVDSNEVDLTRIDRSMRNRVVRFAVGEGFSRIGAQSEMFVELPSHDPASYNLGSIFPNLDVRPNRRYTEIDWPISRLKSTFFLWKSSIDSNPNGCIKFEGQYGVGSNGKNDGMWIGWRIDEFCEYVQPHSLIVDLSELEYEWGDDLFVSPVNALPGDYRVVVRSDKLDVFQRVVDRSRTGIDIETAARGLLAS